MNKYCEHGMLDIECPRCLASPFEETAPAKLTRYYHRLRTEVHEGYSAHIVTRDGFVTTSRVLAVHHVAPNGMATFETENSIYVPE